MHCFDSNSLSPFDRHHNLRCVSATDCVIAIQNVGEFVTGCSSRTDSSLSNLRRCLPRLIQNYFISASPSMDMALYIHTHIYYHRFCLTPRPYLSSISTDDVYSANTYWTGCLLFKHLFQQSWLAVSPHMYLVSHR